MDTVFSLNARGGLGAVQAVTIPRGLGPQFTQDRALPLPLPVPTMSAESRGAAAAQAAAAVPSTYTGPLADRSLLGEPMAVWLGMIGLLIALGWFSSRPSTLGGANPAYIKIGGYNFLAVGVSAAVFVVLLKVLANKFPTPGFTDFANAL